MIGGLVAYPAHATFAQVVDRLGRVTLIKNKQSKDKKESWPSMCHAPIPGRERIATYLAKMPFLLLNQIVKDHIAAVAARSVTCYRTSAH